MKKIVSVIFIYLFTYFLLAFFITKAFAGQATNVNEVSDLFKKEVEDKEEIEKFLENSQNTAVSDIGSKEGFKILPVSEDEVEKTISDLNSIDANNLEAEGNKEREKEENRYFETLEIDYSSPLIMNHKKDTDLIASSSERLMSRLLDGLKELGVDCKTAKGNKEVEATYFLDIWKEPSRDIVYEQSICEEPRNKYDCRDELTVRCADSRFVPGALTNVTGNMTHAIDQNGYMNIGVNKTAYFYNEWGAQNDFIFTFDVSNALGIESFKILQVDWADHVLIKLNDHVLFQSPGVNGKIEMSYSPSHYRVASDGERYYGVDVGTGYYITANTKRYHNAYPNIEGKQYLKDGKNILHIRLVYGRGGKIWLALQFKEKKCNAWQEIWSEKCRQI